MFFFQHGKNRSAHQTTDARVPPYVTYRSVLGCLNVPVDLINKTFQLLIQAFSTLAGKLSFV